MPAYEFREDLDRRRGDEAQRQCAAYAGGRVDGRLAARVHGGVSPPRGVENAAAAAVTWTWRLVRRTRRRRDLYLACLGGGPIPRRTTIQVSRFRGEKRIEIDAVPAAVLRTFPDPTAALAPDAGVVVSTTFDACWRRDALAAGRLTYFSAARHGAHHPPAQRRRGAAPR